jgi:hypothetical protein
MDIDGRGWTDIASDVEQKVARRSGKHRDDPDVQDQRQEALLRFYRILVKTAGTTGANLYAEGMAEIIPDLRSDSVQKLINGIVRNIARERHREALRSRKFIEEFGRHWDRLTDTSDPFLPLAFRDCYPLIRLAVVHRSHEVSLRAFDLLYGEDEPSAEEVAEILNTTVQAVHSAKYNIRERMIQERKFLDLEGYLRDRWSEPSIRAAMDAALARCPSSMVGALRILYAGPYPRRPDHVDASPQMIFRARATFLKMLRPAVLEICRREEGDSFE